MSAPFILIAAFGIGIVAGLRSMMAPAVASWMARTHGAGLAASRLGFMGSTQAVAIFTIGALAELIADKLPKTPRRTNPGSFILRLVTGAVSGATLTAGAGGSTIAGGVLGALGAVVGTVGGYRVRARTVKWLAVPDFVIALAEDAVAIGLAIFFAFRR